MKAAENNNKAKQHNLFTTVTLHIKLHSKLQWRSSGMSYDATNPQI